MPIVVLALIVIAIWLIFELVKWLFSIMPAVASVVGTIFGAALLIALVVGFFRGSFIGIKGYYSTLTEVYGKRIGIALGVALTLLWVGILVFLARESLMGLVTQYQAVAGNSSK